MNYLVSKEIWDELNPVPCVRISFLSAKVDWNSQEVDWDLWCEFCNEHRTEEWVFKFLNQIDYERSLHSANKHVIQHFIDWL